MPAIPARLARFPSRVGSQVPSERPRLPPLIPIGNGRTACAGCPWTTPPRHQPGMMSTTSVHPVKGIKTRIGRSGRISADELLRRLSRSPFSRKIDSRPFHDREDPVLPLESGDTRKPLARRLPLCCHCRFLQDRGLIAGRCSLPAPAPWDSFRRASIRHFGDHLLRPGDHPLPRLHHPPEAKSPSRRS